MSKDPVYLPPIKKKDRPKKIYAEIEGPPPRRKEDTNKLR